MKPGTNPETVNKQLYNYIQKRAPASISHPFLFNMNDWHLYDKFENGKLTGGGQIEYVRMFSLIAWIILFIACINFMNLATARSEKRAREVGVRKVLGAGKKRLIISWHRILEKRRTNQRICINNKKAILYSAIVEGFLL